MSDRAQVATGGSARVSSNPRFLPIDDGAKDGAFHLVRDLGRHQHAARWNGEGFEYGSGNPVAGAITEYASRAEVSV